MMMLWESIFQFMVPSILWLVSTKDNTWNGVQLIENVISKHLLLILLEHQSFIISNWMSWTMKLLTKTIILMLIQSSLISFKIPVCKRDHLISKNLLWITHKMLRLLEETVYHLFNMDHSPVPDKFSVKDTIQMDHSLTLICKTERSHS